MRMRAGIVSFALCAVASTPPAAFGQQAIEATGELRIAAVGETRVVMVSRRGDADVVWEWTFLDEAIVSEDGLVDTVATSVMYGCDAGTRRALVLEAYRGGAFVSATPLYEEPTAVTPGTLSHGALEVICDPENNSDGATFPDPVAARTAMDHRRRPAEPVE